MKILIENLGNIKNAEIELNKLIIFSGKNNSGKTYLNYLLYKILKLEKLGDKNYIEKIVKKHKSEGFCEISDFEVFFDNNFNNLVTRIEKNVMRDLDIFFNANQGTFKGCKIKFKLNPDKIKEVFFKKSINSTLFLGNQKKVCELLKEKDTFNFSIIFFKKDVPEKFLVDFLRENLFKNVFTDFNNNVFLLPAERTGLNLFYKELNINRNVLIEHLQKSKNVPLNPIEIIMDLMISKYPKPISDYINFLNELNDLKKMNGFCVDLANFLNKKIIGGKYSVQKDGNINFLPYKKTFKAKKNNFQSSLDIHLSSSIVKTFFSLDFYLRHMAKKGDYFIIDEPELNLHPDNQRKIARLLVQMVNKGINVIISTHSDYIIKELNNLIMLENNFDSKNELMRKIGYTSDMILKKENVNPYIVDNGEVRLMPIEREGIIVESFDNVINSLNEASDDIFFMLIKTNDKWK